MSYKRVLEGMVIPWFLGLLLVTVLPASLFTQAPLPASARNYNVRIVEQTSAPTSPLLAPVPDDGFGPLLWPVCCHMDWVSQVLLLTAGTDRHG